MAFIVLEGFSATGKTSLAMGLERRGWLRLQESAHAVPKDVPVADRADTAADFSLLGATMTYGSIISKLRHRRNIVSEGYFLGDLAYAKVRYELNLSQAYPSMLEICRRIFQEKSMTPDLYILLKAGQETIEQRQRGKDERERNVTEFFRTRYHTALGELHSELGQAEPVVVETDSDLEATLAKILEVIAKSQVVVV